MSKHKFTRAEREAILFSAGGICHLCNLPIEPGQDWQVSHVDIPEEHGGDEVGPAHFKCHQVETAEVTLPLIAKVRNVRQRHNGSFQPRQPMACGRHSSRSKGMDGRIKPRIRGAAREAALRALSPDIDFSMPPIMRQFVKDQPNG